MALVQSRYSNPIRVLEESFFSNTKATFSCSSTSLLGSISYDKWDDGAFLKGADGSVYIPMYTPAVWESIPDNQKPPFKDLKEYKVRVIKEDPLTYGFSLDLVDAANKDKVDKSVRNALKSGVEALESAVMNHLASRGSCWHYVDKFKGRESVLELQALYRQTSGLDQESINLLVNPTESTALSLQVMQTETSGSDQAYRNAENLAHISRISKSLVFDSDYSPFIEGNDVETLSIDGSGQEQIWQTTEGTTGSDSIIPMDNNYQEIRIKGGSLREGDIFTIDGVSPVHLSSGIPIAGNKLLTCRVIKVLEEGARYQITPKLTVSGDGRNIDNPPADNASVTVLNKNPRQHVLAYASHSCALIPLNYPSFNDSSNATLKQGTQLLKEIDYPISMNGRDYGLVAKDKNHKAPVLNARVAISADAHIRKIYVSLRIAYALAIFAPHKIGGIVIGSA